MHKVLCNHASWNSPSLPPISSLTLCLFAHCYSFNTSDALPPQRPCTCSSCCLGCSSIGVHYTHPLTNLRSWHKCHHFSGWVYYQNFLNQLWQTFSILFFSSCLLYCQQKILCPLLTDRFVLKRMNKEDHLGDTNELY